MTRCLASLRFVCSVSQREEDEGGKKGKEVGEVKTETKLRGGTMRGEHEGKKSEGKVKRQGDERGEKEA